MLSTKDNELVTRVGPGTPMGTLMRRYWIPMLPSDDLDRPDGDPVRVRILGEDLIAFRDTSGTVGLVGAHCPHRGVSLYFARNEEGGLRCPYHGWKFDRTGSCVDMPNERPESNLRRTLRHRAYPCVERGGLIWAYLGPVVEPPPLPPLEWLDLPPSWKHVSFRVQASNWLQALEGEVDPSHPLFLHGRVDGRGTGADRVAGMDNPDNRHPHLEIEESPSGVQIAARRQIGAEYYWRVNQFLLPFWTTVPPIDFGATEPDISGHAWVPVDDEHTLCVMFSYNPAGEINAKLRGIFERGARGREAGHLTSEGALPFDPTKPYGKYWPRWNQFNDYGLDREAQRTTYVFGVRGLWVQDAGCQESMGAVVDRTQEHLCGSDLGIARVRRLLRRAALRLAERGEEPPSVAEPRLLRVRPVSMLLPKAASWREEAPAHTHADGPLTYRRPSMMA